MERKYKITIPEPCSENWDAMTPKENGRYCMSCAKTVVDFTTMLPEEVQHFFVQNQNKNVCGWFKKSQLDSITIQIPSRILYTQTQYHKMFLLALFIAMGTTLFSCADKDGNKQKIDHIEIVEEDFSKVPDQSNSEDSILKKPSTSHLSHQFTIPINEEPAGVTAYSSDPYSQTLGGVPAFYYVDTPPDYPGGFEKFTEFIKNEFQIPKKAKRIAGKIEVSFTVDKVGTLNQIKVFDNIGHETGEEIIRVLQESKKWNPGTIDGQAGSTVIKLNIVLQKDSLNTERKKRNLSKIVSIDFVNPNSERISTIN